MTLITLDAIKAEQTRIAQLIADFEQQSIISLPGRTIPLSAGEFYCGTILTNGKPDYDLVGLPHEIEAITWDEAIKQQTDNKVLPTLRELALARANAPEHFKKEWYWSCEPHASDSDSAWCQYFYYGSQGTDYKYGKLRVRFFRRLEIL